MSEQQSLHEEPGWQHDEREEVRELLVSHELGREALLEAGILKPNAPNQDRFSGQTVQPVDKAP